MQLTFPDIKYKALEESNTWIKETKLFLTENFKALTDLQKTNSRVLTNVSINPKQKDTRHFKVCRIK